MRNIVQLDTFEASLWRRANASGLKYELHDIPHAPMKRSKIRKTSNTCERLNNQRFFSVPFCTVTDDSSIERVSFDWFSPRLTN